MSHGAHFDVREDKLTLSGTLSLCQSLTNAALLLRRFLKLEFSRHVENPEFAANRCDALESRRNKSLIQKIKTEKTWLGRGFRFLLLRQVGDWLCAGAQFRTESSWGRPENRLTIEYSQKRKGGGIKRELGIYSAAKSIEERY
jgi:hypothetical protein